MFTAELPFWQVETKDTFFVTPDKQEANKIFDTYVEKLIPCELFKNGQKQNEFKINT